MVLKSIGVFSMAKMLGALYATIGFLIGLLFALLSVVGAGIADSGSEGLLALVFGVGAVIILPVFYGVLGFIGGAVLSALYNLIAGRPPIRGSLVQVYNGHLLQDPAPLSDFAVNVPVALDAKTEFRRRVLQQCRRIPYGDTLTYAELAVAAGSPRACRAVGNIMARNRIPLVIPCHRVVGSHGSLGGYSAPSGLPMKQRLLRLEGAESAVKSLRINGS